MILFLKVEPLIFFEGWRVYVTRSIECGAGISFSCSCSWPRSSPPAESVPRPPSNSPSPSDRNVRRKDPPTATYTGVESAREQEAHLRPRTQYTRSRENRSGNS